MPRGARILARMNALRCDRCGSATPFSPDATYPRRCDACGGIVVAASTPWVDLAAQWAVAAQARVQRYAHEPTRR